MTCLRSLAVLQADPAFEVFIAENGGPRAMDALVDVLGADDSPCDGMPDPGCQTGAPDSLRRRRYQLIRAAGLPRTVVHVAEMTDNLGFAGGVNFWLGPLLRQPGWEAAWLVNPDASPAPSALAEVVAYSARRGKTMVGSRLIARAGADLIHCRGLKWQLLKASTLAVDYHAPVAVDPDPGDVESRITAPSGAACYATRALIERIGLMDERYFLYFEDMDWGCRAKRLDAVGYAHASIVPHRGGTTIGTARRRADRSPLAVYLETRNCILFVRRWHSRWLLWTILMQLVRVGVFGAFGAFGNMAAAFRGLAAGVLGKTGRPDGMLEAHRP